MTGRGGLDGASAVKKSSGNTFQNIRIGPYARVHLGDSYQIKQENPLDHLPYAAHVSFNSSGRDHEAECLPGTRKGVLRQIQEWVDGPSKTCIFWLNGLAGTGKSTVARTIARTYHDKKQLGANFFFSRGAGEDARRAAKLFTTIAAQLAGSCPPLKSAITRVVEENKNVGNETLRDQWNQLILQTLLEISPEKGSALSPLVLVIDALDECESDQAIVEILRLLAEANSLTAVRFRILITSRPETPIFRGFRAMSGGVYENLALGDIPREVLDKDLSIFFRDRFRDIVLSSENLPAAWPGEATIAFLVQKAAGLFIYAATVCRFIQRNDLWPPRQLLAIFVPDEHNKGSRMRTPRLPSASPTAELDAVYTTVLEQSTKGIQTVQDEEDLILEFKLIIGSLVLLFEPLSTASLAALLDFDQETIYARLSRLRSVLHVPEDHDLPITLLHPSFREFLISKDRSLNPKYWIDPTTAHQLLTRRCLNRLAYDDIGLKKDNCNLRAPGTLMDDIDAAQVARYVPPDMQYACLHWVQHLGASEFVVQDDDQSHRFLQRHLLHWLEVLSLIRRFSEGVMAILTLGSLAIADHSPHMYAFVQDARRFTLHNQFIIEKAPLQVYCSALIFSPESSVVRRQFLDQIPPWVKTLPLVEREWSPCLQVLQGHTREVTDAEFSPDGRLLASGSWDDTVKLWDPATGTLRFTLRGHGGFVQAVAFSPPSGQVLAAACSDGTIKLWNPADGTLSKTLAVGSKPVLAVCFSPDGQILASASDMTISLWDLKSGTSFRSLRGHTHFILALSFSPDGRNLASASRDHSVVLWDWASGSIRETLQHETWLDDVAFSPADSTILASACFDSTVNIWDIEKGARMHRLNHSHDFVSAVAFSRDGSLLASADYGHTVMLWDPRLGTLLTALNGHNNYVYAVAFSGNGKLLVSASRDDTVRLWDPTLGVGKSESWDSHSKHVSDVAFSPNGQTVATASWDSTVKLWNPETGKSWATLTGNLGHHVKAIAFSPDGQLLASGSSDRTVVLWKIATIKVHRTLHGHSDIVLDVSFSPTGQLLASAGNDSTVRLWNPATGAALHVLQCHWSWANVVAFSPDSRIIAGCSHDPTTASDGTARPSNIRLWDVRTGERLQEFEADGTVRECSFDREGSSLQTNRGIIELPQPLLCEEPRTPLPPPSVINTTYEWIWCEKQAVLWLPSDYRRTHSDIKDGVISLGHESGRVTFIRLDEKAVPRKSARPSLSRNGLGAFPPISEFITAVKNRSAMV